MLGIREISLQDILLAREERAERQRSLIKEFEATLICFMVNIPGVHKDTPLSRNIFDEGLLTLINQLESRRICVIHEEFYHKATGAEAFLVVDSDAFEIKRMSVDMEDNHPIGRLFDIDVFDRFCVPIQRETLKMEKRKCLICQDMAYNCVRSRKHSLDELTLKIESMAHKYFDNED